MKKILSVLLVTMMGVAAHAAPSAKVYMEQGAKKMVVVSGGEVEVRTGGLFDLQAGSTLSIAEGATIGIAANPTFSDLTVTYGLAAATAVLSGQVNAADFVASDDVEVGDDLRVTGLATVGETLGVTGALTGSSASFSTTLNAAGQVTFGAGAGISTVTAAGSATFPGTVTAAAINLSGLGQVLLGNATAAQLATLVPSQAKGAMIYNSTDDTVCYSSAAVAGSWILPRGPAKDSAMVSCY